LGGSRFVGSKDSSVKKKAEAAVKQVEELGCRRTGRDMGLKGEGERGRSTRFGILVCWKETVKGR